jgi:hypothetical protein
MARITDNDIIKALVDNGPQTAASLGVSVARLKAAEGVYVVGTQQTGKRGRPALMFGLAQ